MGSPFGQSCADNIQQRPCSIVSHRPGAGPTTIPLLPTEMPCPGVEMPGPIHSQAKFPLPMGEG